MANRIFAILCLVSLLDLYSTEGLHYSKILLEESNKNLRNLLKSKSSVVSIQYVLNPLKNSGDKEMSVLWLHMRPKRSRALYGNRRNTAGVPQPFCVIFGCPDKAIPKKDGSATRNVALA